LSNVTAGLRNLKNRCRRFESGSWEGLLDNHHKAEELLAERFEEGEHGVAQSADGPTDGEAVVAGIRACLDLEPKTLVLQVDLANAFNDFDRVAMFDELRSHFPELLLFSAASMRSRPDYYLDGIAGIGSCCSPVRGHVRGTLLRVLHLPYPITARCQPRRQPFQTSSSHCSLTISTLSACQREPLPPSSTCRAVYPR
jgi:hypothetical protein